MRSVVDVFDPSKKASKWGDNLEVAILRSLRNRYDLFPSLNSHMYDSPLGIDNHYHTLVKKCVQEYVSIRRHFVAKKYTEKIMGENTRNKNTRTTIFKN